jgi:hypothetical protein
VGNPQSPEQDGDTVGANTNQNGTGKIYNPNQSNINHNGVGSVQSPDQDGDTVGANTKATGNSK